MYEGSEVIRVVNKNAYLVSAVVVAAIIVLGLIFFGGKKPETVPVPSETVMMSPTPAATEAMMEKIEISYTDQGFAPATITVRAGTAVTFVNKSSKQMWVASAPHPQHTDLPGFDQLESVGSGKTYTYTFAKVGSWKYHNHTSPTDRGMVVVE